MSAMALFVLYTFSPFLPHLATIIKLILTGKGAYTGMVIRYNLFKDLATESHKHVFPERTPTPLSDHYDVILKEYENFRSKQAIPSFGDLDPKHQYALDKNSSWQTLWIRVYDRDTCIASMFPETVKLVDETGLDAASIMITRMAPGQVLEGHFGPTNLVIRLLMTLKVPQSKPVPSTSVWPCRDPSKCEEYKHEWTRAGSEFIFDDSFWHASENPNKEEERVALWLDMKRPDLPGWRERFIYNMVMGAIRALPVARKADILANTNKICEQHD